LLEGGSYEEGLLGLQRNLDFFGKMDCQDRRDKVFGLHGLSTHCCQAAVGVNYKLSMTEICTKVLHTTSQSTPRMILSTPSEKYKNFIEELGHIRPPYNHTGLFVVMHPEKV